MLTFPSLALSLSHPDCNAIQQLPLLRERRQIAEPRKHYRTTNPEQQTTNLEQRTTNNEPRAMNNEQQTL